MSIEQADVVDIMGIQGASVILTISDHLDWDDEAGHALALQEKINTYLRFIESGEILEVYPQAAGKVPVICVAMRVPPSSGGTQFFDLVRPILASAGVELRLSVRDQSS
jgi:hypothetical protein